MPIKLTQEEFLKNCNEHSLCKNYDFTNTIYKNIRTSVEVECKIHGKFIISPLKIMAGNGCKLCDRANNLSAKPHLSLDEYKIFANNLHNNKYDYSLVIDLLTEKIKVICPTHGEFLIRRSAHIASKQLYGCQKCSRGYSRYEERIEKFLKEHNIKYEYQKKYSDLVGLKNQPLSYDFYIISKNLLIEFDGLHHYQKVKFGKNQSDEKQEKKLADTIRTDRIKDSYAIDNGIDIIRISYYREKELENILEYELLGKGDILSCEIYCNIDKLGNDLTGKQIWYLK